MIEYIRIDELHPHPDNPRKDLGDLTELAASIKANGVLQNLTVVPLEDGYRVVIGHRRLAAAKLTGLEELPCVICDMTPQQQVSTMLIENVQRNDLTVYEQACGFQMALDFGETVESLAQKTGFSESTVRRRVKLMELDEAELKKAVARGASLLDFSKLDAIKDPERKKNVLKKIGTNNFENELERALEAQRREEADEKLEKELESFATRVKSQDGYVWVKGYSYYTVYRGDQEKFPQDADKVKYFYTVEGSGIGKYFTLLRERTPQEDAAPVTMQKVKREREEKIQKLNEATARAYKLRNSFVLGCNCKKTPLESMAIILRLSIEYAGFGDIDSIEFSSMLGCEGLVNENDDYDPVEVADAVIAKFKENPAKVYFYFAYCLCGDLPCNGYFQSWSGDHTPNESLDMIYKLLVSVGYQMSDEEIALQNGTHELFTAAAGKE